MLCANHYAATFLQEQSILPLNGEATFLLGVRHLCEIYGVGVKVASCVLLFSFEKFDAYPEDVWIKKVHAKYFAQDFDPSLLGSYRGLVQQWMFFYERYLGGGE